MQENQKTTFICFNEEAKDNNGGAASMIVRIENMDLDNEKIVQSRAILGEAAHKLRVLLGL